MPDYGFEHECDGEAGTVPQPVPSEHDWIPRDILGRRKIEREQIESVQKELEEHRTEIRDTLRTITEALDHLGTLLKGTDNG